MAMRTHLPIGLFAMVFLCAGAGRLSAQPADVDASTVHYTTKSQAVLYSVSDSTRPYLELGMREPVWVIENGGRWARVRTRDGAQGLVRADLLSNVWIRVSKSSQTVFVYRGDRLAARIPADLGYNFFADKEVRGSPNDPDHWRTPEGTFHVAHKNANSQFYRALVLNYPNAEDAERGLSDGLITPADYEAIVLAEKTFRMPPMGTALGGYIEIHGRGTGQRANWTQGCIAVPDEEMDRIWDWITVGTPVIIER